MDIWLPDTTKHHLPILEHGPRPQTRGIVIHVNAGTFDGTIDWFSGGSGGVGAHLEIGEDRVYQLADLDQTCWHAVDANAFAIGFEHVGFGGAKEWPEGLLYHSANRAAWIHHEYQLGKPQFLRTLWPHSYGGINWGDHPDCPGSHFPWERYLQMTTLAYDDHWGR